MERETKVERGGKSDKSEVRTVKVYFNQTTTKAAPCVLTTASWYHNTTGHKILWTH